MPTRRKFLKAVLAGAAAPALDLVAPRVEAGERGPGAEGPRVRKYNTLGRTGLEVGDIGFGVAVSTDPRLLVEAYHRGINYYDIVPFYSWSVDMIERAFALDAEMRRGAIVASKVECTNFFYAFSSTPLHKLVVECTEKMLKRLGRETIDILQIHSVGEGGKDNLDWLDPSTQLGGEAAKIFEGLKRDGKIRFAGITSHGPHLLDTVMEKAIASGGYDMVMPALNFMQTPGLTRILKTAEERKVGVIAMKALANARKLKVGAIPGRPFSHAAIAWALGQPGVNGLVITIPDRDHLIEYLGASGSTLTALDQTRLDRFRSTTSSGYCRVGCGVCAGACPEGVEIATVLRCDQYRTDYGLAGFAGERFRALAESRRPHTCPGCETAPCERACPFGVPIRNRLLLARHHLEPDPSKEGGGGWA